MQSLDSEIKIEDSLTLTNWLEVLSVREPQTWGDVCQNLILLWDTKNILKQQTNTTDKTFDVSHFITC